MPVYFSWKLRYLWFLPQESINYLNVIFSPVEISRQERWRRLREELSEKGREAEIEALLENLVDAIQDAKDKLSEAEDEVTADTPSDPGTDDSFEDYVSTLVILLWVPWYHCFIVTFQSFVIPLYLN